MMERKITEGFMPFLGYRTYYRIVGDIAASYKKGLAPLVLLHGGPGSTHNYMEVMDPVADSGRAVVMYDQLGCGESYVEHHPELFNKETWMAELEALLSYLGLKEVHLLGQSWGGMLAITYAVERKPKTLKSLILSSTLSSSKLWGEEQHRQILFMSEEDQKAIREAEESGVYEGPAYDKAVDRFMELFCAGKPSPDAPECLRRPKRSGREAYVTAWGPNEFTPLGNQKDWNYTERLGEILSPALVISGTNDLSTPLIAKTMKDGIKDSRWELFVGCRHMCFVEATEKYLTLISSWMAEKD